VGQAANDHPPDRTRKQNGCVSFRQNRVRQAEEEAESQADQPARPGRKLHQRNHEPDPEPAEERGKQGGPSGNDIGNINATSTAAKINPQIIPRARRDMPELDDVGNGSSSRTHAHQSQLNAATG
jgi:hypothetical protein